MVCDFVSLNLRTEVIPLPEFEEREEEEESKNQKMDCFQLYQVLWKAFFL